MQPLGVAVSSLDSPVISHYTLKKTQRNLTVSKKYIYLKKKGQIFWSSYFYPSYLHTSTSNIPSQINLKYVSSMCVSIVVVSCAHLVFLFQPLNPNPDSRWNTYFKDNEILLQIDKDVRCVFELFVYFSILSMYQSALLPS